MIGAMRIPEDARWYRLSLGALIVLAWAVLWVWGASPFAGLLSHRVVGGAFSPGLRLAIFVLAWTLMTVAMMLPTSLPLINLFQTVVRHRPDGGRLVRRMILGYLAVWVLFGLAAYVGAVVLHEAVEGIPGLAAAAGGIGAALLLVAGLYQFTPLKHMCLEKCRSPYSFLVEHWRGREAARDAFRLGISHGMFCMGCCWTLMLLMFVIGGANLGWMLALATVMAAERTTRWGRRLAQPVGVALTLWAMLHLTGVFPFKAG